MPLVPWTCLSDVCACTAGKIHISEATKAALDNSSDAAFEVELRGETDVKVRQVITGKDADDLLKTGNAQNPLDTFPRNFPVDGKLPTCCGLVSDTGELT